MNKKNLNANLDDDNNSSTSNEELSKFKQRLNDARIRRVNVNNKDAIALDINNKDVVINKGSLNDLICTTVNISDSKKNIEVIEGQASDKKLDSSNNSITANKNSSTSEIKNEVNYKDVNLKDINEKKKDNLKEDTVSQKKIINNLVKKNRSKCVGIIKRKDISNLTVDEKNKRVNQLEKKILLELDTKIKREIDELNDLIVQNNDLINKLKDDSDVVSLDKVKEEYEKLNELLKKVTKLIEQVNILNNNYKFEDILNLTDFDDQNIVNDIIEFRDLLDTSEPSKELTEKYKMLDSFILFYREIFIKEENIKNNILFASKKEKEVEERDKKYVVLQEDLEFITQIDKECKLIIDKQNEYMDVLNNRIAHISSSRVVEYRMRGVEDILSSIMLYLSIMVKIPFRNNKVQVGSKALVTGRMLRNLSKMRPRAVEYTKYEADDFHDELFSHLSEVEVTMLVIDTVLDDVSKMKLEFEDEFKNKVPGYEKVESKLREIETSIKDSKKKLENASDRLKADVKVNNRKLVKVKELNERAA